MYSLVRNAHKRFRQGRLSFKKLKTLVKTQTLPKPDWASLPPVSESSVDDQELVDSVAEEHTHGKHCNH